MEVKIVKMSEDEVKKNNINSWPIWEKEVSEFDWYYSDKERCYFIEGEVTVTTKDGKKYEIKKGDYVEFPQGLSCKWKITKPVKKYYNFG